MRSEPNLVPARPANRAEAQAAAHPALSVEVVSTVPGLRALRADYERLDRATGNTLPFCLHEWHVSWCETFLESGAKIRDEPRIHVLRTGTGQCVGIVPMILTERRVGPFTVRSLDALGSDPALTEIRSPLIERGYETAVARALQAQLMRARDWDWVAWRGLDTAFGAALAACAPLRATAPLPDYVLDLPGSWETLHAGLKRNIRESLRHCYNSLKREGHAYALRVNETPDDIPAALERFLVLHRLRAAMAGTVAHPDRFSGALLRRFLLQVCTRLAERGAARVFELVIGGEVVASRIGFVVGGALYLYYSGFEPRWARYSVMTTTQAEAIKYAIACGLRCVNLSPGTDVGKTRWGPRVVHYGEAVQVGRSLRSRLARAAYLQVHKDRGPALWLAKLNRRSRRKWS
jgi:CelD/BcsL family acetyltransferase involved in cellulose biosynthesis